MYSMVRKKRILDIGLHVPVIKVSFRRIMREK